MAVTIQVKRGSRATLPVLALGEYGLTTDTKELFIGGPEGVNIQIAVLDNGGQIPEEQLPEMDISKALAGAELKDQPVDNDGVVITDSAAENVPKRVLWSRIKAALKGYFDPLYAAKSHSHAWGAITGSRRPSRRRRTSTVRRTSAQGHWAVRSRPMPARPRRWGRPRCGISGLGRRI